MIKTGRYERNQDGAMLIIALLFLAVCGVGISAILGLAQANLKTTSVTRDHQQALYANDAGLEFGIQSLRTNNDWCNNVGVTGTKAYPGTVNGYNVSISCTANSGFYDPNAGNPYAIFATGTASDALNTQGGGTPTVQGRVYVNGQMSLNNLAVKNGDVLQRNAPCNPSGLSFIGSGSYLCPSSTLSAPTFSLPSAAPGYAPAATTVGACRVLFPGKYDTTSGHSFQAALNTTGNNYLVSGVYYIENETITLNKGTIIGGTNPTAEPGAVGCASDAAYPTLAKGQGVELIFGGRTTLTVGNQDTVEIHYRAPAAGETGSAGVSVFAVPTTANGFVACNSATQDCTTDAIGITTGAGPTMVFHGAIYAPTRNVSIFASNTTTAAAQRGVVASKISLKTSASIGNGFEISAASSLYVLPPMNATLTSTATDPATGTVEKARAVVTIDNTSTHISGLTSWRTVGVS